MGQYHILVNLTKREYLHPYRVGCGLKMAEQAGARYGMTDALYLLVFSGPEQRGGGDIHPSGSSAEISIIGRWAGDNVLVVGDYAEDDDPGYQAMNGQPVGLSDLYSHAQDHFRDIGPEVRATMEAVFPIKYEPPEYDPENWETWLDARETNFYDIEVYNADKTLDTAFPNIPGNQAWGAKEMAERILASCGDKFVILREKDDT